MRGTPLTPGLLCLALITGCAAPAPTGDRSGAAARERHYAMAQEPIGFTHRDRMLIRDYYRHSQTEGPDTGEQLPPDLERQLFRHGRLPAGVEGRSLPREIDQRLSRLPAGITRVRLGSTVLLIDTRSRDILDLIADISG